MVSGGLWAVCDFPGNGETDGDPYSNCAETGRHSLGDGHASPLADSCYGNQRE